MTALHPLTSNGAMTSSSSFGQPEALKPSPLPSRDLLASYALSMALHVSSSTVDQFTLRMPPSRTALFAVAAPRRTSPNVHPPASSNRSRSSWMPSMSAIVGGGVRSPATALNPLIRTRLASSLFRSKYCR